MEIILHWHTICVYILYNQPMAFQQKMKSKSRWNRNFFPLFIFFKMNQQNMLTVKKYKNRCKVCTIIEKWCFGCYYKWIWIFYFVHQINENATTTQQLNDTEYGKWSNHGLHVGKFGRILFSFFQI